MNQLTDYLSGAIERLFLQAVKTTFRSPRESAFLARQTAIQKLAAAKRREAEEKGTHIPPFLIASIASRCNLYCKGCYARAGHTCGDPMRQEELTAQRWAELFREAEEIGVSFILLAGGEPLLRRDVIEAAAGFKDVVFPVFTNGTCMDGEYLGLFDRNRNLIPVVSLEGDAGRTDERRGKGVSALLSHAMERMNERGIFYGASITVTTENLDEVTGDAFLANLRENGCRVAFFVEYVPVDPSSALLALDDACRDRLCQRLDLLRGEFQDLLLLSFPGDEDAFGGCLAAGRGFFHINPAGGAEPCPFSPFSDYSLQTGSLRGALSSPLFRKLDGAGLLQGEHRGRCALFGRRREVELLSMPAEAPE